MITGVIKNKIDKIWTDIWAGGITNPLTVIEQLTYLMFILSLDEKELGTEELANSMGIEADEYELIFPKSATGQAMRWSKFRTLFIICFSFIKSVPTYISYSFRNIKIC